MGIKEKYAYVEVKQDYHRIILNVFPFHSNEVQLDNEEGASGTLK